MVSQIDQMSISQESALDLIVRFEAQAKAAAAIADPEQRSKAYSARAQAIGRVTNEARERFVLRALHSPHQILEQMTWFWMNHFSVFAGKGYVSVLVADYEDRAIRPRALGKFRDLLGAAIRHPAMLIFLDNTNNAAGRNNENLARELLELHTMGVGSGYSQSDVQELARVLTGLGVNYSPEAPVAANAGPNKPPGWVRQGVFEFNAAKHDLRTKRLFGQAISAPGMTEFEQALDMIARSPATARHITRKMAQFWMHGVPSSTLLEQLETTFVRSDGDIAQTLRVLFLSKEFEASLGQKFRDPIHFVLAAIRHCHDGKTILNAAPAVAWIQRLGQGLYNRSTPDGYPLESDSWISSSQASLRFEVARAIGSSAAGLFKPANANLTEVPAFPQAANRLYMGVIEPWLSSGTRAALERATSPQEFNTLLLMSPEFMHG